MKNILSFILFLTFALGGYAQETIIQFEVKSKKELQKIAEIVSIDHGSTENLVKAYANPRELKEFKKLGYDYKVLPHPSIGKSLTMATTIDEMANWDRYPTHQVYLDLLSKFANDHPDICRLETLGTSEAGREVKVIKITDNPDVDEEEPEFYYTGQMHGDEIIGYIMLLRLIDYILNNYGTIERITTLVDNYEIWINPLSNPDGTYTDNDNTVAGATRANANGVDLNRNFPSPNKPNPTYQNEAEVQMQLNFADNHHFVMSSNIHNGVEVVNYPWDSWASETRPHADHEWWKHVSRNYANTVHENAPNSYMESHTNGVTHGGDWYEVNGGRQDNMGYFKYCREFTLELSDTKMLNAEELPAHWNYNRDALIGYIEECLYGFHGTVKNTNGDPLDAKIEVLNHDKDNSEVYTDPSKGDYYRPIEPGTYQVKYSCDGYIPQTHTIEITDWETGIIKNIVLEEATQTTLSGTVTEANTNTPLGNVKIQVLNTSISSVYTDNNGQYSIPNIYEGNYEIKASLSGYTTSIKNIDLTSSSNTLDFTLSESTACSFENGINPIFNTSGNNAWVRTSEESYDGDYSLCSADISDGQTSSLEATVNILNAGDVSFYRKVSSEESYDWLYFYIDGEKKGEWSGEEDWAKVSYPVSSGNHTFKWDYQKDGYSLSGEDKAWIDYIEFPEHEEQQVYSVTFNVKNGSEPISGASVQFNNTTQTTNDNGQAVFSEISPANNMAYTIDATGFTTKTGTINVTNDDITENVSMEKSTFKVTFKVRAANTPVANAEVTLDGYNSQTTDNTGKAVFNNVEYNTNPGYNYTVTAEGFEDHNSHISVNGAKEILVNLSTINIIDYEAQNITIFPNPASTTFTIKYDQLSKLKAIQIFDLYGKKIYESNITTQKIKVDKLPKGFYTVKLLGKNINVVKKLIIQ